MGEINLASASNYGLQNGVNYGTINAEFHCPPGKVTVVEADPG